MTVSSLRRAGASPGACGLRVSSCTSTWLPGSRRAPNFEVVRRTLRPTARTRPCRRVSRLTIRSASPQLVHPQHDRFVPIQRHPSMISLRADRHRLRRHRPASQPPVQHSRAHAESQAASDGHEEGRPRALRVGDASDERRRRSHSPLAMPVENHPMLSVSAAAGTIC